MRPATTVQVYDLVKARMNEALRRARLCVCIPHLLPCLLMCDMLSGLVPAEDAPDIIANTFLEQVTDIQLGKIRLGFLKHRECT